MVVQRAIEPARKTVAQQLLRARLGTSVVMAKTSGNDARFSDRHWQSLVYFNLYRVAVSVLLLASALLHPSLLADMASPASRWPLALTMAYLLSAAAAVVLALRYRQRASHQLTVSVLLDVVVLTMLMHSAGGLGSGLGVMLLVTLAGAGLVGEGRVVLSYAAMATLAVLLEQAYRGLQSEFAAASFFQAGAFSLGFFAVAILAHLLARRVIANEELARRRGIDLENQMVINQRVIQEMQDGVLVLDREGMVRQSNPRACQLLRLDNPAGLLLDNCSPELAQRYRAWLRDAHADTVSAHVPARGIEMLATFVPTASSNNEVLVFLEDLRRLQEQAQQLKLASLGRLTASIAHEIRNPLSAITHAGELIREERRGEMHERLVRIVLGNAQRLEGIVSDVLALGRRDRAYRERIDLRELLPQFLDEYLLQEGVSSGVVQLTFSGSATLCFDRAHLERVLWNLLSNALRHSQQGPGSVRIQVCDGTEAEQVELHVIDDGAGVGEDVRAQIFEPFFTTHHRGTGLGLYIARELCEINGARLELTARRPGAAFRLLGRCTECL